MPKKLWEFFTRSPRFTAFAVLVNLLLIFLSIELHAFASDWRIATTLVVSLGVLLIFDLYLKKHHDRWEMRRLHAQFIDGLLEAATKAISRVTGVQHLRTCLMIPDGDALRIIHSNGFSDDDHDLGIRVILGTGVAGKAWVRERVVIADLRQAILPGASDWSISQSEDLKVRPSLNSIMSVPIMGGHPYRMLAILNVDSDHDMTETRFFDDDIQHLAYCFSKVLASLLDETD